MSRIFPHGFVWGAATASYQIEGAVAEDGRGASIWDTFSRTPGAVLDGHTGDTAADHYHRMPSDVAIMRDLGLEAYRFSIAWPRIQPTGSGPAVRAGLDFYSRLVDELLVAGIDPVATLYHWDLPQTLEDAGGWLNRETAYRFGDYAAIMAGELGDRISMWTTLNEPWCSAFLGYTSGTHAPGRTEGGASLAAVHHLNLAHGLAARAVRGVLGDKASISVTLNLHVTRADSPADAEAKARVDRIANEIFLQPMLEGSYPEQLLAETAHLTDWSFVRAGDLETIAVPLAVLGVNYYSTGRVRAGRSLLPPEPGTPALDGHQAGSASPWLGCDDIEWLKQPGPYTTMGWNIDPQGMTDLLVEVHERYPDQPLMVTENGAAFDDAVASDGRIHDERRVDYLARHIEAVGVAMDAGVDVRGYFLWSLMDNYEWSYGYHRRFGIIRVDYGTLERIWKDSAYWYREVVRTSQLPPVEAAAGLA